MTRKRIRRGMNQTAPGIRSILGAGLILIGLAAFLILQGPGKTDTTQPVSRSVVPVEVNYPAPGLALQNVNGRQESLADYGDQVVLVNNWATWCPPCKAEIPTLEAYYAAHHVDGFTIIGIEAGETQNEVLDFVQQHSITYPIWLDLEGAAMSAFHNDSLPSSFVIDRHGTIRLSWVGEISREMLEKFVTPLLAEN